MRPMATPRRLLDSTIRQAALLQRLKAGEVRKFGPFLKEMDKRFREILTRDEITTFQRDRLERLLAEVSTMLTGVFGQYRSQLQRDLFELAEYSAGFEARALTASLADFEAVIPAPVQVMAAVTASPLAVKGAGGGKLLEPFVRDWTVAETEAVVGAIRVGAFQGRTNAEIIRTVRGTKAANYADGLLAVADRHAAAVVNTAVQHVANVARFETWKANKVEKYRWVSTLDGRTSEICQSLDGQVFKVGDGPQPPAHINCRSTTVAELDEGFEWLSEGRTRASQIGQVDAKMNYYDWLQTQSVKFQDEMLGPFRGALLREGGLSSSEFGRLQLDRNFSPITLEQMRTLAPLAFDRAGIAISDAGRAVWKD